MTALTWVCRIVGLVQIALGVLYIAVPGGFLAWQGISVASPEVFYPLGMLAARFLVYGVGMFVIAGDPLRHRAWLDGMIAIQGIDFLAGLFYSLTGVIGFEVSAFPMFNAVVIAVLLTWLRPQAVWEGNTRAAG